MKRRHTHRLVFQKDQRQIWITYTNKWEYLYKPKNFLGKNYHQNKLKNKNKIIVLFLYKIVTIQN